MVGHLGLEAARAKPSVCREQRLRSGGWDTTESSTRGHGVLTGSTGKSLWKGQKPLTLLSSRTGTNYRVQQSRSHQLPQLPQHLDSRLGPPMTP